MPRVRRRSESVLRVFLRGSARTGSGSSRRHGTEDRPVTTISARAGRGEVLRLSERSSGGHPGGAGNRGPGPAFLCQSLDGVERGVRWLDRHRARLAEVDHRARRAGQPQILNSASLSANIQRPSITPSGEYVGLTWRITRITGGQHWWHSGGASGTRNLLTRRQNNRNWVVLRWGVRVHVGCGPDHLRLHELLAGRGEVDAVIAAGEKTVNFVI